MSSTSAPFGLRPAFHPSGLDRAQALAGGIVSGYASNILKGQPVQYGTTANSGTLGTIVAAAATGAIAGAFAGVQWTDTTGRARISNYWPANTAYTAGTCVAYFYNHQNIVYEIQADGSLAQATLGSATAVGNGVQGQLRVVDLAPYVDNAWGDSYTIVRVVVANSQFFGAVTAIA